MVHQARGLVARLIQPAPDHGVDGQGNSLGGCPDCNSPFQGRCASAPDDQARQAARMARVMQKTPITEATGSAGGRCADRCWTLQLGARLNSSEHK